MLPIWEEIVKRLAILSGITSVVGNPITRSVVIEYEIFKKQEADILLNLNGIIYDMGYRAGGQNCQNQLFWSLTAGGALLLSFISRKIGVNQGLVSLLEMTGFGITAYSVATHCDGQQNNVPSKAMHLDTITGLVSMLSIGSDKDRVFGGLFVTWLFNFLEIIGWLPITRWQCGSPQKQLY
jgi:hypothetical protein